MLAGLQKMFRRYSLWNRNKAAETLQIEINELENVFGILVMGQFVGLPSPPAGVSLSLIPYMDETLSLMLRKSEQSNDSLAMLVSQLNADL